jgi:hypothetical protein
LIIYWILKVININKKIHFIFNPFLTHFKAKLLITLLFKTDWLRNILLSKSNAHDLDLFGYLILFYYK